MLSLCFFEFSVGTRAFVLGLFLFHSNKMSTFSLSIMDNELSLVKITCNFTSRHQNSNKISTFSGLIHGEQFVE